MASKTETGAGYRAPAGADDRRSTRPIRGAMFVDERDHHFARRSSSAWAKNAAALRRISLVRRSSRFSRSSSFSRSRSLVRRERRPSGMSGRFSTAKAWLCRPEQFAGIPQPALHCLTDHLNRTTAPHRCGSITARQAVVDSCRIRTPSGVTQPTRPLHSSGRCGDAGSTHSHGG